MKPYRIAIFASGSGSNAEAICQYFQQHPRITIALILSNNADAYVLERAKKYSIPSHSFTRSDFREPAAVLQLLEEKQITHVVLAGFLWLIPTYLVQRYPNKIINIHPALLPKFGGKGMYGHHVHEAVKAAGETISGITIHLVNEHYDQGKHLFQASCTLSPTDTADDIGKKVLKLEHENFPRIIEHWILNT